MIKIEGGTFFMGPPMDGSEGNPARQMTVDTFYMSRYQVTQAEWLPLSGSNPSNFEWPDLPVHNFRISDASMYCNRLSILSNLSPVYDLEILINLRGVHVTIDWTADGYRLPTETEWEFAARGGNATKEYIYAGGNNLDDVAWYNADSGGRPHPVGRKAPNELGLYDMSGNVWEMCENQELLYRTDSFHSLIGRGGDCLSRPPALHPASRAIPPSDSAIVGFRIVRNYTS